VRAVEEMRPPMTTRASGFWISEPMPWLRAAGRKPITCAVFAARETVTFASFRVGIGPT